MSRILVLSRYGGTGASSRLRTFQYLGDLEQAGFTFTVHSLLDDAYLQRKYRKQTTRLGRVVAAYSKRLKLLLQSRQFDAVWIEKEALPWLPAIFERVSTPVLLDYDDAIYHRYDQHSNPAVRWLLGRKIDQLMARAAVVVAGNSYIATHAAAVGARRVVQIPTCVDLDKYLPADQSPRPPFTVGWIGTPETAKHLASIALPLKRLAQTGDVVFRFIGAPADLPLGFDYTAVPWSESTEAAEIARFSCGIMPLPDQPFERGKSGYKLIQYMACALPVVASPVGANCDIVSVGDNGFLAAGDEQWIKALLALKGDHELGRKMGAAGRHRAEAEFDRRLALTTLGKLLKEAAAA